MDKAPQHVDWVTERARCTAIALLEALEDQARKDVEVMKRQPPARDWQLAARRTAPERFIVTKHGEAEGIVFAMRGTGVRIAAGPAEETRFAVVPLLCADGVC